MLLEAARPPEHTPLSPSCQIGDNYHYFNAVRRILLGRSHRLGRRFNHFLHRDLFYVLLLIDRLPREGEAVQINWNWWVTFIAVALLGVGVPLTLVEFTLGHWSATRALVVLLGLGTAAGYLLWRGR